MAKVYQQRCHITKWSEAVSVTVRIRPVYGGNALKQGPLRYTMEVWAVQRCETCNHLLNVPAGVVEISDDLFDRWALAEKELDHVNAKLLRAMRRLP